MVKNGRGLGGPLTDLVISEGGLWPRTWYRKGKYTYLEMRMGGTPEEGKTPIYSRKKREKIAPRIAAVSGKTRKSL